MPADHRSVRFLFLPPEHDPDSFVRERGRDAFAQAVADAVPLSRQLLEHSAQDCDLDTAEGRARMLTQARPLWEALPDGALRAQLLDALAERARMADADLARLWGRRVAAGPSPGARRPHPAAPRTEGARDNATCHRPPTPSSAHCWRTANCGTGCDATQRDLLLALDSWHGEAIRWLDRHLENHGAQAWPALREDLGAAECADWADRARALVDRAEMPLAYGRPELQQLVDNLAKLREQARSDSVKQAVMRQPNRF